MHVYIHTTIHTYQELIIFGLTLVHTSVVPINRITIGKSRLLGNFVTIGIGKF